MTDHQISLMTLESDDVSL